MLKEVVSARGWHAWLYSALSARTGLVVTGGKADTADTRPNRRF